MKRNFDLKKWMEGNEVTEESLGKLVDKMVWKRYEDIIRIRDRQIEENSKLRQEIFGLKKTISLQAKEIARLEDKEE